MKCELIEDTAVMEAIGQSTGPRTRDVVHISDVYKILMQRLQPKRFNSEQPMDMTRVQLGLLFESMLEEALARRFAVSRPGEIISDEGIYMSPDGVNPGLLAGEEFKCTWMSSRHGLVDMNGEPLDKFVHWFVQMMAYAKWLEVLRFILRVFFVNGNYNRSGVLADGTPDPDAGPTLKSYDITFTEEEIETNWTMLMNIAREEGLIDENK